MPYICPDWTYPCVVVVDVVVVVVVADVVVVVIVADVVAAIVVAVVVVSSLLLSCHCYNNLL